MKKTKAEFMRLTRGMLNEVRQVQGLNVRWCGWDNERWQLVDGVDFDTANTIKKFHLRDELWDFIKNYE